MISLPLVTCVSLNESISLCCMGWKKERERDGELERESFFLFSKTIRTLLSHSKLLSSPFLIQLFLIEFFFCICSWCFVWTPTATDVLYLVIRASANPHSIYGSLWPIIDWPYWISRKIDNKVFCWLLHKANIIGDVVLFYYRIVFHNLMRRWSLEMLNSIVVWFIEEISRHCGGSSQV